MRETDSREWFEVWRERRVEVEAVRRSDAGDEEGDEEEEVEEEEREDRIEGRAG